MRFEENKSYGGAAATAVDRLFGAGESDRLFHGDTAMVPWSRQSTGREDRDMQGVRQLLNTPVHLFDVDPRHLLATQPRLVRHHFLHYFRAGSSYPDLARTSADPTKELNRFPVVEPDGHGRFTIWSGHHRAAAALLRGQMLQCRVVGWASEGSPLAITPNLHFQLQEEQRTASTSPPKSISQRSSRAVSSIAEVDRILRARGADRQWSNELTARLRIDLSKIVGGAS